MDITFGHLIFITDFAKSLLQGKMDSRLNKNVFGKLIDVNTNVSGDIVLTIKNVWTV